LQPEIKTKVINNRMLKNVGQTCFVSIF